MDRFHYDRLLNLAERGDLTPEERIEFIEQDESLADAPGGVHAALPRLIQAAALLRNQDTQVATYVREAIRLLQQME